MRMQTGPERSRHLLFHEKPRIEWLMHACSVMLVRATCCLLLVVVGYGHAEARRGPGLWSLDVLGTQTYGYESCEAAYARGEATNRDWCAQHPETTCNPQPTTSCADPTLKSVFVHSAGG